MNQLVSIIIPTRDRKEYLFSVLEDLNKQNYRNFEVIVVETSDHPIRKEDCPQVDFKLKIIYRKGFGSHQARNEGIKESQAKIILFLDDDVAIKNPDFLTAHLQNYENPQVGGVAGRVTKADDSKKPGEVKVIGKVGFLGKVIGDFNGLIKKEVDHGYGCNLSLRRQVLEEVGGFSSLFGGTAYFEETDLCLRVKKKGFKIIFEPQAMLYHLQASRGGNRENDFYNWRYWYFHNYVIFFLRNFNKLLFPLFWLKQTFWIFGSSLKRRDLKNLKTCLAGLRDGFKDYLRFHKNEKNSLSDK